MLEVSGTLLIVVHSFSQRPRRAVANSQMTCVKLYQTGGHGGNLNLEKNEKEQETFRERRHLHVCEL